MNRVVKSVAKMRAQIKERIKAGLTTKEAMESLNKKLDMNIGEHARFQEVKTIAYAEGVLTIDEADFVYRMLGETPSVFNKQEVAVKVVFTELFKELLQRQMARR